MLSVSKDLKTFMDWYGNSVLVPQKPIILLNETAIEQKYWDVATLFFTEVVYLFGGKMKMIAAILERKVIRQILTHLKLPSEIPQIAPARSPPWVEYEAI